MAGKRRGARINGMSSGADMKRLRGDCWSAMGVLYTGAGWFFPMTDLCPRGRTEVSSCKYLIGKEASLTVF